MQVVTFDSGGVSGHRNHLDTSAGVVEAVMAINKEGVGGKNIELLFLVSSMQCGNSVWEI